MTKIIPGIYQLQLPLPFKDLGNVNVYLVHENGGSLLIDTGVDTEESFNSLKEQLDEIGINTKDISRIISTHCHGDHYGMAGRLKQLSQADISLHYLEKELVASMHTHDRSPTKINQMLLMNGAPPFDPSDIWPRDSTGRRRPNETIPDTILKGGETITINSFSFQVIWTPGHSPGHISLYEPDKKLLFSGDFILPNITPNISLGPQSNANPLGSYINSLNMIRQLDVSLVLPAHGNPFKDMRQRVEEIIQHHKQRNSEILQAIKSKPKTAYQIASEITWIPQAGGVNWQKLSMWERRLAMFETLAHLEFMRVGGKVDKFSKDDIIYYQQT